MININYKKPCKIYFIGIGGISMSGLAEILSKNGFSVSGSDRAESATTEGLTASGIEVRIPQSAENITPDIDLVVYTAAIHPDNPEYARAKELELKMASRAELLGAMMEEYKGSVAIAGTHGKTTTTSMLTDILMAGESDPTISVGGFLKTIGSNVRIGGEKVFLTEACEYTDSFLSLYPKYSAILNVEAEHLDYFKDLSHVRNSFRQFASQTAEDGALVIGADIPDVDELTKGLKCEVIKFSADSGAVGDITHAVTLKDLSFGDDGCATFVPIYKGNELPALTLKVPGRHNVNNALAAIGIAIEMGIDPEVIIRGLSGFTGADRRFEYKGCYNGATIVDDYAHHPTEIRAALAAAKGVRHERLIVCFQPHTYTRTKAFLDDFADALSVCDLVCLADIYAAREADIYGISSADLRDKLISHGTKCEYFDSFDGMEKFLKKNCANGDLLITMGAGNIYLVGEALLKD